MTTKKDLVIVILATFCLTLTLFTILPTHSSSSTATLEYDPWLDYNDDGRISLQDLVALAQTYGTTGDPTKNVNIGNHTTYESTDGTGIAPSAVWTLVNYTKGYKRVTVAVSSLSNRNVNGEIYFWISGSQGSIQYRVAQFSLLNVYIYYNTFEVTGSNISIIINNNDALSAIVRVGLYMTM